PHIDCSTNITATTAAGASNAFVTFSFGATDDCGLAFTNCSRVSGSSFDLGTTTVTCAAMDTAGNSTNCSFDVIVQQAAPEVHDLAIVRLKVPKAINLKGAATNQIKRLVEQIQNRSPHDETITNLGALLSVTLSN